MADEMTPSVDIHNSDPLAMAMAMQRGSGGDSFLGGGGLLGGLVLGSLLRNGNGLLGGDGGGAVSAQAQANMSLMAGIGDIKQSVAVGTAQMEASQTAQTAQLSGQLSSVAAALTNTVSGTKDAINAAVMNTRDAVNAVGVLTMQTANQTQQAINADGEKTRALIVQQYEATLNRQLSEANAALVELRSEGRIRENGITITQQVNQQQQQQQMNNLWQAMLGEMQNIRAANQAINIGAGTLTANPTNTNTNTRVN